MRCFKPHDLEREAICCAWGGVGCDLSKRYKKKWKKLQNQKCVKKFSASGGVGCGLGKRYKKNGRNYKTKNVLKNLLLNSLSIAMEIYKVG